MASSPGRHSRTKRSHRPESPAEIAKPSPRDPTFDILKGIGILEVIIHHVTAHSSRKYAQSGNVDWWALMVTNRLLHFAVPVFLLASALLLARSVARKPRPDWKRFGLRRLERTVWPYLIWSAMYWLFRVRFVRMGSDVYPTPLHLPFGGEATIPALFAHPTWLLEDIILGKAYFHLYFMVVLIQFSLLFPFLYAAFKSARLTFLAALTAACGLQLAVLLAQAQLKWMQYPASTVLWYLPPILVGMWLGLNWSKWPKVWRRWKTVFTALAVVGGVVYLALAIRMLLSLPITGYVFNIAIHAYTLGMAFLLLGWAGKLAAGSTLGYWLARIGDKSLPLFLIHPMIMYLLSGPKISVVLGWTQVEPLAAFVLTLGITWMLTWILNVLRLDQAAFGRRFEPGSFTLKRKRLRAAEPVGGTLSSS